MAISLRNEEACRLAHELGELMGSSAAEAIKAAVGAYHDRHRRHREGIAEVSRRLNRDPEEMLRELSGSRGGGHGKKHCPHCGKKI